MMFEETLYALVYSNYNTTQLEVGDIIDNVSSLPGLGAERYRIVK